MKTCLRETSTNENPFQCQPNPARRTLRAIVFRTSLIVSLALAVNGYSTPAAMVELVSAQYTTVVSVSGIGIPDETRTTISTVPFSDYLIHPSSGLFECEAIAGLFGISAFTAAEGQFNPTHTHARASAEARIRFSPNASGAINLNLQFTGTGQWYFSEGFVRLFDVTAGLEAWGFDWLGTEPGTVPWIDNPGGDPRATALLNFDSNFNAGSIYELSIFARTDSNPPDSQRVRIQVVGFELIPEPSTAALLGLGALVLAAHRRCQRA